MSKRFPGSVSYREHCAYQVAWYEEHGKYPDRIKIEAKHTLLVECVPSTRFVQGDYYWNEHNPTRTEYVYRQIADYIYEKLTGIKA